MEGLPKLPGWDFENRIKLKHHVPHSFDVKNGYRIPKKLNCGIGGDPLKEDSIAFHGGYDVTTDSIFYDPILTYGRVRKPYVQPFRPNFVMYDKIVLTFKAFFQQGVAESRDEIYRVRYVNILYFLEDDTISVMEPSVKNSGLSQGRLIRRAKIQKNNSGLCYDWKDFNIGKDIKLNGIVFHVTDCDKFTKEFMMSQGVELNEPECLPLDPLVTDQFVKSTDIRKKNRTSTDKLRRFLDYQGIVLQFDSVLDETDQPFGEYITYKMFYYLEDDTVAIKELKENREGRDYFPMLLKRTKLPKNWKEVPLQYPSIYLERSEEEVTEYYSPIDFKIGEIIQVFGRKFLLLDCDAFTRKYYEEVLKKPQKNKLCMEKPIQKEMKSKIPDYIGLGSPEDSLASYYNLVPKAPKKDIIKYLLNTNKYLRYGCIMDSPHPENAIRKFILQFCLSDGKITILEPQIRNSGITGGSFLRSQLVWKPDCDPNKPEYYSPKDITIGTTLIINNHRFIIKSADLYVYRYMQNHPELFTAEAVESVRKYHIKEGNLKENIEGGMQEQCKSQNFDERYQLENNNELTKMEQCLKDISLCDKNKSGEKSYGEYCEEEAFPNEADYKLSLCNPPGTQIDIERIKTGDECRDKLVGVIKKDFHSIPPKDVNNCDKKSVKFSGIY